MRGAGRGWGMKHNDDHLWQIEPEQVSFQGFYLFLGNFLHLILLAWWYLMCVSFKKWSLCLYFYWNVYLTLPCWFFLALFVYFFSKTDEKKLSQKIASRILSFVCALEKFGGYSLCVALQWYHRTTLSVFLGLWCFTVLGMGEHGN